MRHAIPLLFCFALFSTACTVRGTAHRSTVVAPSGDHDRGHGNDPDGHDEDNPGRGHGRGRGRGH